MIKIIIIIGNHKFLYINRNCTVTVIEVLFLIVILFSVIVLIKKILLDRRH